VLKYQDKLTTEEFKKAIRGYVNDEKKDVTNLMKYAISRKVRQKVQNVISIWL
jgi:phage-related minor tail protein